MVDSETGGALASSLIAAVSDPERLSELYEVLGEFCHHFRNRLNSMKLSLYLAKRGAPLVGPASWDDLERTYLVAERLMEQLQQVCRPAPLMAMRLPLGMLLDEREPVWNGWLAGRGRRLELSGPRDPAIGEFDPSRLGQGLDALAAWRSEAGEPGTPIRVCWRVDRDRFHMNWDESPPENSRTRPTPACPASLALAPAGPRDGRPSRQPVRGAFTRAQPADVVAARPATLVRLP